MQIPLPQLEKGKTGIIKELAGGRNFQAKMNSLGVRIEKSIRIGSSHRFGGPIVVEIDNMRIAIGRGMANRIIVETK